MPYLDILLIFIIRYLRKILPSATLGIDWKKYLNAGLVVATGCLIGYIVVHQIGLLFSILSYAMLGILVYRVFAIPSWRIGRTGMYSILPLAVVFLAEDIIKMWSPTAYAATSNYFQAAFAFGTLWAFVLAFIIRNQSRTLEKEKLKLEEKEREVQASEKMKVILEQQVQERTAALTRQKEELQLALKELKEAQAQLIHSEKMASLGQLTAGIAHEIQNPLNFVNNFSEVNKDLIREMQEAISKGDMDEVRELAGNISGNEDKIIFHGRRADGIVKSMLQHSRSSSDTPSDTDVNNLCDEYLRLAFHGMRAKDKSFNAAMETDFDAAIGKVKMVPQEVGRVLLNLLTNAFYEVNEKRKKAPEGYQPMVKVTTKKTGSRILIEVSDNGNGITEANRKKIFQPFFTTKPTGQGTGLGLSLSYDIIKACGGTLSVESEPGTSTTFIIALPNTQTNPT